MSHLISKVNSDKIWQHCSTSCLVCIPRHSLCACVGLAEKHQHGTLSQEPMLRIASLVVLEVLNRRLNLRLGGKTSPSRMHGCVIQSRVQLEYALILEYCLLQVQTVKLCIIIKIFIDSLCKILLYLTILTCKMTDTTKYRTFS